MKKYLNRAYSLATSGTAKDTYILFIGNIFAAFLGFVTTLVLARSLSISDFGVYSAATNLIVIISSLTDLGISSGLVSFASAAFSSGDTKKAYEYSKAAFLIKIFATIPLVLFTIIFAQFVSNKWLATTDPTVSMWVGIVSLVAVIWGFVPYILQSKKLFLKGVIIDISLSLPKAVIPYFLMLVGLLTVNTSMAAFAISAAIAGIVSFAFVGFGFLRSRPSKNVYIELAKFSSWIGVNRIISSISGKLDVQMLAAMAGATLTGLYSIPMRLSSIIIVFASSFSAVLAPRFASFGDKIKEKRYLIKASLVIIPIIFGILLVTYYAKPFVLILFGDKYIESVPVFQALCIVLIPYIISVPPVAAIIYSMKKTKYIGVFSFYQIAAIFLINYFLIPIYGAYAPAIAFGVVYLSLAIYSWIIILKHYWIK